VLALSKCFRYDHRQSVGGRVPLARFPVIVGEGHRLFPDRGLATGLTLVESRTTGSGVAIHVYRPTGRPESARSRSPGESAEHSGVLIPSSMWITCGHYPTALVTMS
jgi:hypothetical protein